MNSKKIFSTFVLLAMIIFQVAAPTPAYAAGVVGTGTPGSCTQAALDTALTSGGAVTFNCGAAPHTITVTTTKTISSNTQIDGGGLITLSGGNSVRIFVVPSGSTLVLSNLTLANGNSGTAQGGAMSVSSGGTANISAVTFSNNTSAFNSVTAGYAGGAGAIYNAGTISITKSTFSGNTATGPGGDGGAILSNGSVSITNSTFYGNSAATDGTGGTGGAIRLEGGAGPNTITHVTFSNNANDVSWGTVDISNTNATLSLSILANSVSGFDCTKRNDAALTSTNNLIENDDATASCSPASILDPALGVLQNNGGTTQTMAITTSSSAYNFTSTCPLTSDQRDVSRPQPAAGNCDLGAFELDRIAPDTSLTGNPSNPSADNTPTFSFTGNDGAGSGVASFECRMDLGAFSACTTGSTFGPLSDSSHTFQVRAIDNDANTDATPASYTWVVDTTAPNTSITASPSNPDNDNTPSFSFSGNDGGGSGIASFECQMDAGGFSACTSGSTFGPLTDGSHTFQVRAIDNAGIPDPTPASSTWMLDTTAPDVTINSQPANPTNSTAANFTFSSTDGTATFTCDLDNGGYSSCTSSKDYSSLSEGSHTFSVRVTDTANNSGMDTYTWTIDVTAPSVSIDTYPAAITNSTAANFTFSSTDGTATFTCDLDNGGYSSCSGSKSYSGLTEGSHTFSVKATDSVANVSTNTYTWTIDLTAPTVVSVVRASADNTNANSVDFTVTFLENVTGVNTTVPFDDFNLFTSGVAGASITAVNGSGSMYTVTVATGTGNGTIRLDVVDDDSIRDAANNALAGGFSAGETYTIVKTNGADTVGVFRPSDGALYLKNTNATGFADVAINYGIGGDYPVVGDWDGDGDATIGIYRNGTFHLRNSNTIGFADLVIAFGTPGDQPVAGDWDGDGDDTIGVYRSSIGTFFLRNSNTSGAPEMSFTLGIPGDVGIAGDWNGDGSDTTGVFRPGNGALYLKNTNSTGFADIQINYGLPGDKPVTGDWDNDGIDTIGIYRNGTFHLRNSNTIGFADLVFGLGINGDMPIAGNWDGQP